MSFINNAGRGRNGLVQYVLTIIMVIAGYIIGQIPMTVAVLYKMYGNKDYGTEEFNEFSKNPDFAIFGIDRNVGFFLILFTFIGALAALYLGIKYLHRRNFLSLFSVNEKIDWNRIFWSTGLWFLMLLAFEMILIFLNPDDYSFKRPGSTFIILFFVVLLVLPLQTAFEELFVRAYVFQAVSYHSGSVFAGFMVSILLFSALHGANPEIAKYGVVQMMTYYLIAGIFLGLIVIIDDRIELAIGIHTATNMFGAIFVTYEGAAIQTDSLYLVNSVNPLLQAAEFFILSVLFLIIFRKKYNLDLNRIKFWKSYA